MSPDSSFNTAVSFTTNTNWQGYGGETTMSYLTQMLALTVQNFVSAAAGMAVLVALIRGFTRHTIRHHRQLLGRSGARHALHLAAACRWCWPLLLYRKESCRRLAPIRRSRCLNQPLMPTATPLRRRQIAVGPAASQIAIKQLGTNGGGFFNVNSSHPFENPTPLSNFLEMLAILLIPAALCYTFGEMVGDRRQGWAILAAMARRVRCHCCCSRRVAEQQGNPVLATLGVDQTASELQPGGNMEGKETRFGIVNSALWAVATTAASNGSVNSMHDSYTPLGGLVPMWLMQLGEVIFGGVGSGLYGMLVFAIVAVFIAGLMVGRTPEYLGKKIGAFEMKMAALAILFPCAMVLLGTAVGVIAVPQGERRSSIPARTVSAKCCMPSRRPGTTTAVPLPGLGANTPFYNGLLGTGDARRPVLGDDPVLAIAGSLAAKKTRSRRAGHAAHAYAAVRRACWWPSSLSWVR